MIIQDAFGPFSDSAAASGSDPFTFPSNIAESMAADDSSFGDFGDFGDFQSAHASSSGEDGEREGEEHDGSNGSIGDSGEMTPTADSWSFASVSSAGSVEEEAGGSGSVGRLSESPKDREGRTA